MSQIRLFLKNASLIILFLAFIEPLEAQERTNNNEQNNFDYANGKFINRKSVLSISLQMNAFDVTVWDAGFLDGKTGYGLNLSYEHKFFHSHSLGVGIQAFIDNIRRESLRIHASYRYYHNLKKRIKLGKTGDNFAANYILFEPCYLWQRDAYEVVNTAWDFEKGQWAITKKKQVESIFKLYVGYGIQRYIGNHFFFDTNFGLDFQEIGDINSEYFRPYIFGQFSIGYIIF